MKTVFALVDCNNFYASCEKLFRPDLRDTPVIVLSNNDGCVVARSREAKALWYKNGRSGAPHPIGNSTAWHPPVFVQLHSLR